MAEPREMVSTSEAMEIIGRSRDTVLRMAAKGRLTIAYQAPNNTLFFRDEVERMAEAIRTFKGQDQDEASA